MNLDELERLARDVYARNCSSKFGHPKYSANINSQELLQLLSAVLEMLPVVRAAEEWRDEGTISISQALADAIDAFRAGRK